MASFTRFLKSSILSKVVMAATGLVLGLFIIGHMAGNLQLYMGQERMNKYAEFLQSMGPLLWVIRFIMLTCFVLHVWTSIRLKFLNMSARPVPYEKKNWIKATLASRTMLLTGSLIGTFLLYHILHFTTGTTNPSSFHFTDPAGRHDVYTMMVLGYQDIFTSGIYILGMILLAFHLNHAIASMFQTLGINHPRYNGLIENGGMFLSIFIAAGFASLPIGVLTGLIQLPAGVML